MTSRFLPTSQISGKMYDSVVNDAKMVSLPDTMPLFANNYWMQMTETGVRWVVSGLPQDGACTDLFENLSEISWKGDLSNATTFNPPLFSLVYTFKQRKKLAAPAHLDDVLWGGDEVECPGKLLPGEQNLDGCNVSPSPIDVSPTKNSWMLHPLDKVSLGYCAPDQTIPSLNTDFLIAFWISL